MNTKTEIDNMLKVIQSKRLFDDREMKAIKACLEYNNDPFGDVAHNLKVIVAKLVEDIALKAIKTGDNQ